MYICIYMYTRMHALTIALKTFLHKTITCTNVHDSKLVFGIQIIYHCMLNMDYYYFEELRILLH